MRTARPAAYAAEFVGTFLLVYVAAPVAGALLAALGYRALTAERAAVTAHLRRQIDELERSATAVD